MEIKRSLQLAIILLLTFISNNALAQDSNEITKGKRLSISYSVGKTFTSEKTSASVMNALKKSGLDEVQSTLCFFGCIGTGSGKEHPSTTSDEKSSHTFSITFDLNPNWSVGFIYQTADDFQSNGYKNTSDTTFLAEGLDVEIFYRDLDAFIPMVNYRFPKQRPAFSIFFGPSFNVIKSSVWYQEYDRNRKRINENHTKIGFVSGGAIRIPDTSRFFLDIGFQYSFIGKSRMGPYQFFGDGESTRIDPFRISNNYWQISFGGGIRLF